jgi:hypothetical protein
VAQVRIPNLPEASPTDLQMSLSDVPIAISSVKDRVVAFFVPPNFPLGPAVLRLIRGNESALPVVVDIERQLPVVVAVRANSPISGSRPAAAGEQLSVTVNYLGDPGAVIAPSRVKVVVAGVEHEVEQVIADGPPSPTHQVVFTLGWPVPSGSQPMTVTIDKRVSAVYSLTVK